MPEAPVTVADALRRLGEPKVTHLLRPVQYRSAGTLLSIAEVESDGHLSWRGALIASGRVEWLGAPVDPVPGGPAGSDADRLLRTVTHAAHNYLARLAEIDEAINARESEGGSPTLAELGQYRRLISRVRAQVGRITLLLDELEGPLASAFPGIEGSMPALRSTVLGLPGIADHFEESLRDLLLLRDSHESNRLAAAANQLSTASNRIAAIANSSNLRMLGLAYVALVIALLGAVIVIPNTAATILGMPSAGWVPGGWVDLVLVVTAAVPLLFVLSRPWIRAVLAARPQFEKASAEGMADLPEVPARDPGADRERLIPRSP
ncbi:MAG: hypothetical protein ACYCPN_00755 [Thermoplasmata archaeon]